LLTQLNLVNIPVFYGESNGNEGRWASFCGLCPARHLEAGDLFSVTKHLVPLGWEDKIQLITGLTIPGMWREFMRRNVTHEWRRLGPPTTLTNVSLPQNFH